MRVEKKKSVDPQVLNTARIILHYTIENPISNFTLQGYLRSTAREIKDFVKALRGDWLLPVGSNKNPKQPVGYYWIYTAAEYLNWSRPYRSQAIDQLVTLYRNQRANFPELSGQEAFDFADAIHNQLKEAL
jgi:hypothetical protein